MLRHNAKRRLKIKKRLINKMDYTTICKTLERNEVDFARLLIKRGYSINPPAVQVLTTPLHLAIKMGHKKLVKQLLRRNALLEVKDAQQMTPLHVSLKWQLEDDIAKMVLLETVKKHNATFLQVQLMTKLHAAVMIQDMTLIKKYLRKNVDVNHLTSPNCPLYPQSTALHIAVDFNDQSMVECLLSYAADVRIFNRNGLTPIHLADHHSPLEIIDALLDTHETRFTYAVNPMAPSGLTHWHVACKYDHHPSVEAFIRESKVDVNIIVNSVHYATYPTALHCVVLNRYSDVVLLLENGADISIANSLGETAVHFAYVHRREMIIDLLLRHNAEKCPQVNPSDCRGVTHLHIACCRTELKYVMPLLVAGADVNLSTHELAAPEYRDRHPGYTPLQAAIKHGRHRTILILMRHGADINYTNGAGDTPLIKAAATGNQVALVLLLRAGARINETNKKKETALIMAVKNQATHFADLLIEYGASIDLPDESGKTAVYWACYFGKIQDVHTLRNAGCNMQVKDNRGRTLLHAAMGARIDGSTDNTKIKNYTNLVRLLLQEGLELNGRDDYDNTPLHVAVEEANPHALMVLLEYRADMELSNKSERMPIHHYKALYELEPVDTIMHYFAFHIEKLRRAKERCIPSDMDPVLCEIQPSLDRRTVRRFNKRFEDEFNRMRNCHLDRYTTLYDIAFMSANDAVVHLENLKLHSVVDAETFREDYPLFGYLVKRTFKKAWNKAKLVRCGKEAISYLHVRRLPLPCCEAILRHLDDRDIQAVTDAVTMSQQPNYQIIGSGNRNRNRRPIFRRRCSINM